MHTILVIQALISNVYSNNTYGTLWKQISNVLNDIAEGKENNSKLARTIKAEIDEALSNGYKNIYGQIIMFNEDYLKQKGYRDGVDYFKQKY